MVDDASMGGDLSGTGTIDPMSTGSVLLATVTDSVIDPGRIEIWASNIAFDPDKGIVSFDVELVNLSRIVIPPPVRFVVTEVVPSDIAVVEFDGVSRDGFPFYDFSDALGEDDLWTIGERTAPVAMRFHTVTARSFAIGFRIELGPAAEEGVIGGVVFRDENRDGDRDICDLCDEVGIPGITVALEKPLSTGGFVVLLARTDSLGRYRFGGLSEGVYRVMVNPPVDAWEVTSSNPLLVTLVEGLDGRVTSFFGANFGLYSLPPYVGEVLFGPILVGPWSWLGVEVDSTFINPPSMLPVMYSYCLDVAALPIDCDCRIVVDTAAAWINGELVFTYGRSTAADSVFFAPKTIVGAEAAIDASPEACACRDAFATLLEPLARLGVSGGNLERLAVEYRRTERRARALENVLLPEVEGALSTIQGQLELADQEEAVRIRLAGRARSS